MLFLLHIYVYAFNVFSCSLVYARINSYYTNGERHGVTADEYARAGNSWEAGQIFQQRKILYLLEDKEYLGEKRRINWKPFSTRPGSHENERWLIIHRESRREPWHNLEYPSPLGVLSLPLSPSRYASLLPSFSIARPFAFSRAHLRESSSRGTACKILEAARQPRQRIISRRFSYIAA